MASPSFTIVASKANEYADEAIRRLLTILLEGKHQDAIKAAEGLLTRKEYADIAIERLADIMRHGDDRDSIRAAEVLAKRGLEKPRAMSEILDDMSDEQLLAVMNAPQLAPSIDPLLE